MDRRTNESFTTPHSLTSPRHSLLTPTDLAPRGANQSAAWYVVCQELPGCEYITATPAPESLPYELHPNMDNVMRTMGVLLGAPGGVGWAKVDDLKGYWNSTHAARSDPRRQLIGQQSERVHRSVISDEVTRREIAELRLGPESAHSIKVDLERAHRLATVTHHTQCGAWAAESQASHLRKWAEAEAEAGAGTPADGRVERSRRLCLGQVWPALLGSAMLPHASGQPPASVLQAVLSSPWSADRSIWVPLANQTNEANVSTQAANTESIQSGKRALYAIEAVAVTCNEDAALVELLPELLQQVSWKLMDMCHTPSSTPACLMIHTSHLNTDVQAAPIEGAPGGTSRVEVMDLATALADAPPSALGHPKVREAIQARDDCDVLELTLRCVGGVGAGAGVGADASTGMGAGSGADGVPQSGDGGGGDKGGAGIGGALATLVGSGHIGAALRVPAVLLRRQLRAGGRRGRSSY